jgi:sulfur carrier protein ThiS adenylyltransferase
MRVYVNEQPREVEEGISAGELASAVKPGADLLVVNGFPVGPAARLSEGDRLVLIRRGETPGPDELDALLAARHSPQVHQRLKRAAVGVAGCGGLGSAVAISLVRVGVGRLVLADFDVVEPSNLNRQQFFVDQLGMPKVEALAATLARVNPAVHVEAHAVRVTEQNAAALFGEANLVVEAFDRADQKLMLVEALAARFPEKPVVMGSGMAGWGASDLLRVQRAGTVRVCGDQLSEAAPGMGLMAPRVGIVANMQANEAMELLLGPDPHIAEALERKAGTR